MTTRRRAAMGEVPSSTFNGLLRDAQTLDELVAVANDGAPAQTALTVARSTGGYVVSAGRRALFQAASEAECRHFMMGIVVGGAVFAESFGHPAH